MTFVDGRQHDFWRVDETRLRAALARLTPTPRDVALLTCDSARDRAARDRYPSRFVLAFTNS